jgi:hypothetical protein
MPMSLQWTGAIEGSGMSDETVTVATSFDDARPPLPGTTVERPWYFGGVVHDDDTADDLVHGLSYGAIGLGEALALLETDIPSVVDDWHGGARALFDEQMPGILAAGHQLVAILLAAGSSVMAAYESAHLEAELRSQLRAADQADRSTAADRVRR